MEKGTIKKVIIYFLVYSFLGWFIDTGYRSYTEGFFAPGSFTFLPLTPLYGFGALGVLLVQEYFKPKNIFVQFFVFMLVATFVEYTGGIYSEIVFGSPLWDYSDLAYNYRGRIALFHSVSWGLLGVILVRWVHPFLSRMMRKK